MNCSLVDTLDTISIRHDPRLIKLLALTAVVVLGLDQETSISRDEVKVGTQPRFFGMSHGVVSILELHLQTFLHEPANHWLHDVTHLDVLFLGDVFGNDLALFNEDSFCCAAISSHPGVTAPPSRVADLGGEVTHRCVPLLVRRKQQASRTCHLGMCVG